MLQNGLKHSDSCILFGCLFFKAIERVAFFPWHTIFLLAVSVMTIPGSFGALFSFVLNVSEYSLYYDFCIRNILVICMQYC